MPTKRTKTALQHTKNPPNARSPRKSTKNETILRQLARSKGASIIELQKAVDWQPHSVRAALTGLRKEGHAIERLKGNDGVTRYRIARAGDTR